MKELDIPNLFGERHPRASFHDAKIESVHLPVPKELDPDAFVHGFFLTNLNACFTVAAMGASFAWE